MDINITKGGETEISVQRSNSNYGAVHAGAHSIRHFQEPPFNQLTNQPAYACYFLLGPLFRILPKISRAISVI